MEERPTEEIRPASYRTTFNTPSDLLIEAGHERESLVTRVLILAIASVLLVEAFMVAVVVIVWKVLR